MNYFILWHFVLRSLEFFKYLLQTHAPNNSVLYSELSNSEKGKWRLGIYYKIWWMAAELPKVVSFY